MALPADTARLEADHKHLAVLINLLRDALLLRDAATAGELLERVAADLQRHFVWERDLLKAHAYSRLEEVLAEYRVIVVKLEQVRAALREPPDITEALALLDETVYCLLIYLCDDEERLRFLHAAGGGQSPISG